LRTRWLPTYQRLAINTACSFSVADAHVDSFACLRNVVGSSVAARKTFAAHARLDQIEHPNTTLSTILTVTDVLEDYIPSAFRSSLFCLSARLQCSSVMENSPNWLLPSVIPTCYGVVPIYKSFQSERIWSQPLDQSLDGLMCGVSHQCQHLSNLMHRSIWLSPTSPTWWVCYPSTIIWIDVSFYTRVDEVIHDKNKRPIGSFVLLWNIASHLIKGDRNVATQEEDRDALAPCNDFLCNCDYSKPAVPRNCFIAKETGRSAIELIDDERISIRCVVRLLVPV
jgi:hypothetical protein